MIENRNIFQALEDYFTGQLDRRFDKKNRFGDVVEDYGNEMLDYAKTFAGNAGDISFSGFREAAPDMLDPYIRAAGYLPDMAAAGLLGAIGLGEKGVAALAEGIAGGTESENRLARDLLGAAEVAGVNPQGRIAGILAPYMQSYMKARIPDYQYAGRSLLQGDLEGVREAFTETDMLPRAVGADVPKSAEEIRKLYADGQRVVKETPTGFYTQDGTFRSYRSGVERYSPSVRAAENLPQNKGSYEQLREWMVKKGGANLDELQWTGADSKFSGKEVTKEELVNYLNSRTPIIKEDTLAASGTIGGEAPSSDEMLRDYLEMALPDEVQYYKDEVIPEMVFEQDGLLNADNLVEAYRNYEASDFDPEIDLSDLLGNISDQENRFAYASVPVQGKHLKKLMNDLGYENIEEVANDYYKVDGLSLFTFDKAQNSYRKFDDFDEAAEYYGFDAEEMAESNLIEMAEMDGLYSDPAQFYQVMLGRGDAEDYYNLQFLEGDTEYSEYFPAGGRGYEEKIYSLEDYDNLINDNVDMESASHFTDYADGIVSHARTASYPRSGYEDESIYLFGEGQSDIGQRIRRQKQSIAQRLEALPTYTDEELRQYAEHLGVTPEYYQGTINRERTEIQNDLRIRNRDQLVALNNYEQSVKDVYNDYNDKLVKRMRDFIDEFGSNRSPNIRSLDDSDSYNAFLKDIDETSETATKLNNEKIEADFRRRYRIAKNNALDSNDSLNLRLLVGDLDEDKANWFDKQNVLFELYKANALDATNHTTSGNPNALKGYEKYPVRTSAQNSNPMSQDSNGSYYNPDAHYFNNYVLDNKSRMLEYLADAEGLRKEDLVKRFGEDLLTDDKKFISAVKFSFNDMFVQNNRFQALDVNNMTASMFEDITQNLSLPSLKKYTEETRKSKIKVDVDINALEQSDDYKKAFPMSDVQSGTMEAFLNAAPQDSINYVNLPPLTESTNKWLDMTLKNNLYDAIKRGDDWFALPNASMVKTKTGGQLKGHQGFYENIAPKRLEKILKKIDKNAKLEQINMTNTDKDLVDRQPVLGFRLTDEFIKKAYEKGIPQLGVVGGVGLMDFMVRDNKDGRNDSLLSY